MSSTFGFYMHGCFIPHLGVLAICANNWEKKSFQHAWTIDLSRLNNEAVCRRFQFKDGQIIESHSISAGLDYPGIGLLPAYLHSSRRNSFLSVTNHQTLQAGLELTGSEGILPALETAQSLAALTKMEFESGDVVVVNLSGRGNNELATYFNHYVYE